MSNDIEATINNNVTDISFTVEKFKGKTGASAYQAWLDSGNNGTKQEFLNSIIPTDEMNELVENAKKAEANAKASEESAKISEENAITKAYEANANTIIITNLATQVNGDADIVARNKENVADDTAIVVSLANQVASNAEQVNADKESITTLANEASNSAAIATNKSDEAIESANNAFNSESGAKESESSASASATNASESKIAAQEAKESLEASLADIATNTSDIATNLASIGSIQDTLDTLAYKTMTLVVDNDNSNPETSCTYDDDAKTMTPGSSEWDEFFNIKPCLFKKGEVNYYLDPNDFTKKEDGTDADITTGLDGDVMIEVPRIGLKISKVGNVVTTKITNNPSNPKFSYYAHTKGNGKKEYFYVGAYKGYVDDNGKLRSLSGKTITANKTISSFRNDANKNGNGYGITAFFQLTLIQAMFQLKYKNLNSQSAVGNGYGNGKDAAIPTGGSENYGMCMENCTGTEKTDWDHHVKCFGIEDLWLNIYEFIDGVATDANFNILTTTSDFENINSTYEHLNSSGFTANSSGYVSEVQGGSDTGYLPAAFNAGSTTNYCDGAYLYSSRLGCFGGYWGNGSYAGLFRLLLNVSASYASSSIAARLMFL